MTLGGEARWRDGAEAPPAREATAARPIPPGRFAPALALAVAALTVLLYLPTLSSSFAYDDIDYLNQAADVMAGRSGFWATMLRPQGEHLVVIFRLALQASAHLFGTSAPPFRLLVLAAHAATACLLGLVAFRYAGSRRAAAAAALAYVAPCGFSSMWIWFPSGASLPFGLLFLTAATTAIAWRERLGTRRARLLAGAGVLLALLSESTLAPLVVVPALLDEEARRRAGQRRPPVGAFALFALAAAAAMALLVSTLYTRTFGPHLSVSVVHGVPRSLFLLLAAPFRLFFPGVPIAAAEPGLPTAVLGSVLGLAVAGPVAALLLALWRRGAPRLAAIAALAGVGPLGFIGLVGLGRWQSTYRDLYDADRYFFPLLLPIALLAGAVVHALGERLAPWPRKARAALFLCLAAGLAAEGVLHRRAMAGRMPYEIYRNHARRFAEVGRLAERLREAARALPPGVPPLSFPDAKLWFPDVHNGYLSTRLALYIAVHGPGPRLRLAAGSVGARDSGILNPLLAGWARAEGERLPYLSIAGGRLADAHLLTRVDFRAGPQTAAVVGGFQDWEGASRWMGGRGELRLRLLSSRLLFELALPSAALRRAYPGWTALPVHVTVVDEATGFPIPLGTVEVAGEGVRPYRLDASPFLRRFGNGRPVHLVLAAERTWRPAEVLPGSRDGSDRSVQVFSAGLEGPPA